MRSNSQKGFTIIEVLVALALAGMATTAIYTTYTSQQRSYVTQQEVSFMQQNLRASMYLLTSELRMAGFDPTGNADAEIVAVTSSPNTIRFTADLDGDGAISTTEGDGEDVTYALYIEDGKQKLGRKNPTTARAVAENIEVLDLTYLDDDNNTTTDPDEIRSIQITLVAKTDNKSPNYSVPFTYQNLQGATTTIAGDGFRRASLSFQINCRNLDL